jgi:hypothetical protein
MPCDAAHSFRDLSVDASAMRILSFIPVFAAVAAAQNALDLGIFTDGDELRIGSTGRPGQCSNDFAKIYFAPQSHRRATLVPELTNDTQLPQCFPTEDEPLCLYTSLTFSRGRGISIITTPSIARTLATKAAWAQPSILDDVNVERAPPYEARSLPGRGIGLIMNTTLQRGDRIFSHTPAIVINHDAFDDISEADRLPLQKRAVEALPKHTRDLFMALCGHFGGDLIDDIINTNSFEVELGEDEESHSVVLPETSVCYSTFNKATS